MKLSAALPLLFLAAFAAAAPAPVAVAEPAIEERQGGGYYGTSGFKREAEYGSSEWKRIVEKRTPQDTGYHVSPWKS
ncbi:hypothetical protein EW026_g3738 [Hermanssonia centrifuga]|uniref:Uncharacterized protein n=1 Tax=Hermanssonia centrifuga TaxID=98765 RepID=A0A4S4KL79_9APHY|nr:hypothetical protein EW026_g3738 [Hermanssonia centrifuga]